MRIGLRLSLGFTAAAALVAMVGLGNHLTNVRVQREVERLTHSSMIDVVCATDMALALDEAEVAHREWRAARAAGADSLGEPPGDADSPAVQSTASDMSSERAAATLRSGLVRIEQSLDRARQSHAALVRQADRTGNAALASALRERAKGRLTELKTAFTQYRQARLNEIDPAEPEATSSAAESGAAPVPPDRSPSPDAVELLAADLRQRVLLEKQRGEREFTGEVRGTERSLSAADQRNAQWTLLALASVLALAIWMNRSIGRPIELLRAAAVRLGQGRLDARTGIHRDDELGTLAQTFDRMAADLAATTVSKAYLDSILDSLSEMIFVTDRQWRIRSANPAALANLGFTAAELFGKPLPELLVDGPGGTDPESLLGQRTANLRAAGGCSVPVLVTTAVLRDAAQLSTGYVASAVNIAERQQAEARLQASLEEKEVLLREVHHRVKNNLQIISSLLSLQAHEATDPQTLEMFAESQSRIRSMALIHEQLYRSNQFASIDFGPYARQLCEHLQRAAVPDKQITLQVDSAAPPLSLDQAVPCGMVLSELVANALKHAFPAGQPGEVRVEFTAADGLRRLVVADNGVGIGCLPRQQRNSLGLTVVEALVRQLKGQFTIQSAVGTRFEVTFPAAEASPSADPGPLPDRKAVENGATSNHLAGVL